jgi:beta-glucosidase
MVAGTEIVQLYLRDVVASVTRPLKELKSFQRVHLRPGEKKIVTFNLTKKDFAFYNKDLKQIAEPGEHRIMIGPNSRDLKEIAIMAK